MKRLNQIVFFLLLLFLPTQFGIHFWPDTAIVLGRRIDYLSPTIYFFDLLFVVWFILRILSGRHQGPLIKNSIYKPAFWMGPFTLSLISLATLRQHLWSIVGVYFVFRLWQAVCLIYLIRLNRPQLKQILIPLCLGAIPITFLAVGQFLTQGSIEGPFYFLGERRFSSATPGIAQITSGGRLLLRPYATFSHPNTLGGYLTIILALVLFSFEQPYLKSKPTDFFCKRLSVAMLILGIFLSFSRTAWFVAAGLMLLRIWQYKKQYGRLVLGLLLTLLLIEELFWGRIINNLFLYPEPLLQRWDLIIASWLILRANPLWGAGLGNFIPKLASHSSSYSLLQPVHSIYLLWAAETGLIGISLVGYLLFKLTKTAVQPQKRLLLTILGSGLVLGLFDHYLITQLQTRNLWLLLLSALSV